MIKEIFKYIFFTLIALGFLRLVVLIIVDKIEDIAIRKSGAMEAMTAEATKIKESLESGIKETQNKISSLQELAFDKLPSLKEKAEEERRKKYTLQKKYYKKWRWYVF